MAALITRRQALQGGLVFAAIAASGLGLRLDGAAPGARVLSAEELAIVRAAAEAMFPKGPLPIDGVEAGVAEEVDRLCAEFLELPAAIGFRYVLRALEWGTAASCGQRFTALDPDERRVILDIWADPTVLPRRVASDSIKLVLGMAYFMNPDVLASFGWRATCPAGSG
jgi:hypothetical protein